MDKQFNFVDDDTVKAIIRTCVVDNAILNHDKTTLFLIFNGTILTTCHAKDFNVTSEREFLIAMMHICLDAKTKYYGQPQLYGPPIVRNVAQHA